MKKIITLIFKINLILLIFVFNFIPNQLFASNENISFHQNSSKLTIPIFSENEDWKILLDTKEISIYYLAINDNPCLSYKLKIVNHTNKKHTVTFGLAGKFADNCKSQNKNISEFEYRRIEVLPNTTIIGDKNAESLLLPATKSNIHDLIQNLGGQ